MRSEPVSSLRGIGPNNVRLLEKLGIRTFLDLALHLPYRYEDRTRHKATGELELGDECLVRGSIMSSGVRGPRRSGLVAHIDDGSGPFAIRFIHYYPNQARRLQPGAWIEAYGRVRLSRDGLEMVHPDVRISATEPGPSLKEYRPVYPSSAGLTSVRIRKWIEQALRELSLLPNLEHEGLTLEAAIRIAHAPDPEKRLQDVEAARRRIALDEMLGYRLVQRREYRELRQKSTAPLDQRQGLGHLLMKHLGFQLTGAQRRVVREVLEDLSGTQPMHRLLQGDVGSGKTVVAAFAALRACENGVQTAIMAPTELLAEQHHQTLSQWLSPLGIDVGLLLGRQRKTVRNARAKAIASGADHVIVGTHALFQRSVSFKNLGLVIIDEQHRFGVHQRMQLRDKGQLPHQLVMTATPIPRTLQMSLYANMDVSTIDELPPNRQPVTTLLRPSGRRREVLQAVSREIAKGRQAYWVVPAIADSDAVDMQSVESALEEIRSSLPKISSGMLHGKMSDSEKSERMDAFREGKLQLVVATTVVEVGVDVPNVSVMVVENSERMGLAQLHQLRGRVGRGPDQSYCVLLHDEAPSEQARNRLRVLAESSDGFEIAEKDLQLRGGGDVLGARQSGDGSFKVFDPLLYGDVIEDATELCERLQKEEPQLALEILGTWAPEHRDYTSA